VRAPVCCTVAVEVPGVHATFAASLYWRLRTVVSLPLPTQVPSTGNVSKAGAVQLAFVKAASVGFGQVVDTAQDVQLLQESVAPSSTVKGWMKGVEEGHATVVGATMQAEKPAGTSA
jgi:hypothetical protein